MRYQSRNRRDPRNHAKRVQMELTQRDSFGSCELGLTSWIVLSLEKRLLWLAALSGLLEIVKVVVA